MENIILDSPAIPPQYLTPDAAKNYISIMCSQIGIDPRAQEVIDLGIEGLTKQKVNKLLIGMKMKEMESLGLTMEQKKQIIELGLNSAIYPIEGDKTRLARALQDYENHTAIARDQLREATSIADAIRKGAKIPIDITPTLVKIVSSGFYKIKKIERQRIEFETKPVVLTDVNPDAGVSRSCYMGSYVVAWMLFSGRIQVFPHKDNINAEGNWHPHINSNNEVCWGNAATLLRQLIRFEAEEVFNALQIILCNFNGESPFVEMSSFMSVRESYDNGNFYPYERQGRVRFIVGEMYTQYQNTISSFDEVSDEYRYDFFDENEDIVCRDFMTYKNEDEDSEDDPDLLFVRYNGNMICIDDLFGDSTYYQEVEEQRNIDFSPRTEPRRRIIEDEGVPFDAPPAPLTRSPIQNMQFEAATDQIYTVGIATDYINAGDMVTVRTGDGREVERTMIRNNSEGYF